MTDTPLAKEIQAIDAEDSGRLVATGDFVLPKCVYAQGVDSYLYTAMIPRFSGALV